MATPLHIPRYIALVSNDAVPQEVVKAWFSCVRSSAPTGTVLVIPSVDDQGMPRTVSLVHREIGDRHHYIVPLTRDLEEPETEAVVTAFVALQPDADYDIENTSPYMTAAVETPAITVDGDQYLELCTAWAKRQHDMWFKERGEQGWRYGPSMSLSNKTNPLMVPWEQLPDKYRKPNVDEPQALLDLLNNQGYTVITKAELESMIALMQGS